MLPDIYNILKLIIFILIPPAWNVGKMEYWNIGSFFEYCDTEVVRFLPLFHHSNSEQSEPIFCLEVVSKPQIRLKGKAI
jgi:hypothetical protein